MRTSSLIIGILIIGFFITGFYAVTNELASSQGGYDVEVDDSYETAFDKSNNVSEEISDDWQEIANFTTNKGSSIGIITLVPDFLSMAKNTIFLPFTLMEGMTITMVQYMHLPEWTITIFMATFSIIAIFAIGALILRYRYV